MEVKADDSGADGCGSKWIEVETVVKAPIHRVWSAWTTADDVMQWNFASDDWCCPKASCELKVGGTFCYRMEAKDQSAGFDFEGKFNSVEQYRLLEYKITDGRKVRVEFAEDDAGTKVKEGFDAETEHSVELQQSGWQSILNNFKTFVEAKHSQR
eukprot:TRINITY_DN21003_c0_g1_i1.p1 TRINITY_DN21003_c0_g1~~TRINITY_DN21003_c0_g1_i1.p1  ORF type:complete len:155 (-),score=15.40 TRINITY_DN21003_c0_g1_i1:202-666(-)